MNAAPWLGRRTLSGRAAAMASTRGLGGRASGCGGELDRMKRLMKSDASVTTAEVMATMVVVAEVENDVGAMEDGGGRRRRPL